MQPDDDLGHVNHDDMKDLLDVRGGQDRIEGRIFPSSLSRGFNSPSSGRVAIARARRVP